MANGIQTKIIIWDHNFDMSYYPINILNDPVTRQYVAGTGWHGYGGDASAIDDVQELNPDKDVYFTEQSGGEWNTDSRMGNMFYYMKDFLMASVNRGSKNFIMWNLALNSNNGPPQRLPVVVRLVVVLLPSKWMVLTSATKSTIYSVIFKICSSWGCKS